MKYFKDQAGEVWGFEEDGSQDHLITEQMTRLTDQELFAHLNPAPSREEISAIEIQWRADQMPIALETITAIQLGADDVGGTEQQWKEYWLALRKWTDNNPEFPDSDKRPVAPS